MNVLAIGAHPDDIEIGCGGALARHVRAGDRVSMLVMTTGDQGPQDALSRVEEQLDAARIIGADLIWGGFADGAIPPTRETVAFIDEVVGATGAEVMYTHAPKDTHQDHATTSACSLAGARQMGRVLCYQSPSSSSFDPTVFIDVGTTLSDKLESLSAHRSQVLRCDMVDLDAVEAGVRYWGGRARTRHAEAFETPRLLWEIGTPVPTVRRNGHAVSYVNGRSNGRLIHDPTTVEVPLASFGTLQELLASSE